jgi:hypothetical protein
MRQLHAVHPLPVELSKGLAWSDEIGLGRAFCQSPRAISAPLGLLSLDRFYDLILERSLEPPQLRCFQDASELHPNDYLVRVTSRRRASQRLVDTVRLSQLLDDGVTVVLDAVDSMDPTLEVGCRALQWWLGEYVQVNAYLTTGASSGFPVHWDDHDVLVVQVAGSKAWQVRGISRVAPMHRDVVPNLDPSDEVVWEGVLEAGDAMHIPRGHWHSAHRSDDGFSLHLTFGVTQRTGVDWLAWLADRSRDDLAFRSDLASGDGLRRRASALVERSDPHAFLQERRDSADPARFLHSARITPETDDIVCVTQFPPRLVEGPRTFEVIAAGQRLMFKPAALGVAEACLSGLPASVELLRTEFGGKVTSGVVTALLESRICAPLTSGSRLAFTALG